MSCYWYNHVYNSIKDHSMSDLFHITHVQNLEMARHRFKGVGVGTFKCNRLKGNWLNNNFCPP